MSGIATAPRHGRRGGVTGRAVLIGLVLLPVNIYSIVYMELVRGGIWPTVMTLLFTAVSTLFVLVAANMVVQARRPHLALERGELITIYSMLAVGSGLAGADVVQTLLSLIGRATYYATPENGWASGIVPALPRWLMVEDMGVLRGYYEGQSTFYRWEVVRTWAAPLGAWLGLVAMMVVAMFALNVLFRRQWVDAERLNYPTISLPLELTRTDPPFLHNRTLWIGFALAAALDLLNGINYLVPSAPGVNTKILIDLQSVLTEPPWQAVGWFPITIYPFAIGLGFLIPLDLVFSCWVFYLVWKLERVFVVANALDTACMRSSFDGPYSQEQVTGVWITTLTVAFWMGRHHLRETWRRIRCGERREACDAMSYRSAFALACAGAAGMVAFCSAAGMSPGIAAGFVAVYLALSLYIARMRAELGPPAHDMYGAGPDVLFANTIGAGQFSPGTRAAMASLYWLNRESYRCHPMPAHAEALKAASVGGLDMRRLWWVLLVTAVLGAAFAMWACLHLGYRLGAIQFRGPSPWFAQEGLVRMDEWAKTPRPPDPRQWWAMGAGAVVAAVGLAARVRWLWFPLHPVGYAVSGWWAINLFWFPLMVATILKGALLRYAGLRGYRAAVPFFLGIVLGEFVVGGMWQLAGALLNTSTYAFWI